MDFQDQINRIERAEQLGALLATSIQDWPKTSPFEAVASIAEDRLSWELRLQVNTPPPLGEWGLRFGEAVHHLRAALDNAAVAIARESGVTDPKALKAIQFPICGTAEEWKSGKKRIASLPSFYQSAIEQVQPFQRPPATRAMDLLLLLRDLDNSDKHHLQMKARLETASLAHEPAVEFETEEGAAASVPPDTEVFAPDFTDGGCLLLWRTKGRIAHVKGAFSVGAVVQADLGAGHVEGATEVLAALCFYTRLVMGHLAQAE